MFSFLQKNLVTISKIPSYRNGLKNHRTFLIKRDIDPIDSDIKSFQKKFYDDANKKYDVEHEKWITNDDKENEISMEKDIYNDRED
jgi:hypothetical protein